MNTRKYIYIIASLLLFTACASADLNKTPAQNTSSGDKSDGKVTVDIKTEDLLSLQDQLSKIVKAGDVKACDQLTMQQYKDSCEANILANKAIADVSINVCSNASKDDLKKRCELIFTENQKSKESEKVNSNEVPTADVQGDSKVKTEVSKK
jgi:uncharacterized lipoprotein YajG